MLMSDLDEAYRAVSNNLNMSMEQVLFSAAQIYMERLTLESYESFANIKRVCGYSEKPNKSLCIKD